MEQFSQEKHEQDLDERYRKLAAYDAFDKLVDMALDGTITLDEAITAYKADLNQAS